jgi:hypothetical protein
VTINCFTFALNNDVCDVLTNSRLPPDRLKLLLEFVFCAYAPIAVIAEGSGSPHYSYIFAQSGEAVDISRLLRIVSHHELGWHLSDGILFSPRPSQVEPNRLAEAIAIARRPSHQLHPQS